MLAAFLPKKTKNANAAGKKNAAAAVLTRDQINLRIIKGHTMMTKIVPRYDALFKNTTFLSGKSAMLKNTVEQLNQIHNLSARVHTAKAALIQLGLSVP